MDNSVINSIISFFGKHIPFNYCITDLGGRIIASQDNKQLGQLNLVALKSINTNGILLNEKTKIETFISSITIEMDDSPIGMLIIEKDTPISIESLTFIKKSFEMLYLEKIHKNKEFIDLQMEEQFNYEWLFKQESYENSFIERGKHYDIDVTKEYLVMVIKLNSSDNKSTYIKRLISKRDILIKLHDNFITIIFPKNERVSGTIQRMTKLLENSKIGISNYSNHLNTAYINAKQCLTLGCQIFPNQNVYFYDKMSLPLLIANGDKDHQLAKTFQLLDIKGKNAFLMETVIAFIKNNGEISATCAELNIHRNSIQYRIKRIEEICGKNLQNYYDLLYMYASYISYLTYTNNNSIDLD